jgi:hypothetical protein
MSRRNTPYPLSYAVRTISGFVRRWAAGAFHRIFDGRDSVLADGLDRLTLKSPAPADGGFAHVHSVTPALLQIGTDVTVTILGSGFLGTMTKGTGSLGTGTAALNLTSRLPGRRPVRVVLNNGSTGSTTVSVSISDGMPIITVAAEGVTSTNLATAINNSVEARMYVQAAGSGSGITPSGTVNLQGTSGAPSPGPDADEIGLYDASVYIGSRHINASTLVGVGVTRWDTDRIDVAFPADAQGWDTALLGLPITLIIDGVRYDAGQITFVDFS